MALGSEASRHLWIRGERCDAWSSDYRPIGRVMIMSTIRAESGAGGEVRLIVGEQQLTLDCERGSAPIELLVASLGACMVSSGRHFLRKSGIDEHLQVECDFSMNDTYADQVSRIRFTATLPQRLPTGRREALLRVLNHCAVHNPLHMGPRVSVEVKEAPPEQHDSPPFDLRWFGRERDGTRSLISLAGGPSARR